jgi:hypothetical protein
MDRELSEIFNFFKVTLRIVLGFLVFHINLMRFKLESLEKKIILLF